MSQYCQSPPSEIFPAISRSQYHCRHDAQLWPVWGFGCNAYGELVTIQRSRCAGCNRERRRGQKRLSLDHNHKDGRYPRGFIRGLLCAHCNDLLTEGVVALIERRGSYGELRLPGGDVVSAQLVEYVLDPPGKDLNLIMPDDLVDKMELRAAEVARRQATTRGQHRTARREQTPPAGDVDPDDRWTEPRPLRPVPSVQVVPDHLTLALRGTCPCEDCVARQQRAKQQAVRIAAELMEHEAEVITLPTRTAPATAPPPLPLNVHLTTLIRRIIRKEG